MNICLLGNNLTNLVLANILLKKKINVDIISQSKPSILNSEIDLKEVGEARSKIPSIFHD